MNNLKELNFYNFFTDLIFNPEHAIPEDRNKSLALSIALGIFSLGAIPLVVGAGWGISRGITWIKESLSPLQQKTDGVARTKFEEPVGICIVKEPIRYQKEAKGSKHVIPKNKNKPLGKGASSGEVYELKNDPDSAVKVISSPQEYEIGAMLGHPVLAKSYELYIKEYADGRQDKHKLVMEKVNGKSLTKFQQSADVISRETAIKLIEQAKGCCKYLFRSGVYWADVNDGNIFIENRTEKLRLIDFGHWKKEENAQDRAKRLLVGAMELTTWIVGNSSCVKKDGIKDREKKKVIAFPEKFFNEQIQLNQVMSLNFPIGMPGITWMETIAGKLEGMNEEQMEALISSYFDEVIANLKKA